MTLREELCSLLNSFSAENTSNTPDFILAEYLIRCLDNFDSAVIKRETWCGRKPLTDLADDEQIQYMLKK